MLRLKDGNPQQAWDDLQTCHRLSRLVAQGPTPNECLTAFTIDGMAFSCDWQVASFLGLTAGQAQKFRDDIRRLPALPSIIDKYKSAGRFSCLDYVCATACGNIKADFVAGKLRAALIEWIDSGAVDWDQLLRWGNEHIERMLDAAHRPTWHERLAAAAALDREVDERYKKYRDVEPGVLTDRKDKIEARKQRAVVTQGLFAVESYWLLGSVTKMELEAENHLAVNAMLTDLAFALAAYRIEHGRYPEKLDSLAPKYLAKVPNDPYGKGPLKYRIQGDGYILYSLGPNGIDDGGPLPVWDQKSDDIGISMPQRADGGDK
jgi:hypothetical protein